MADSLMPKSPNTPGLTPDTIDAQAEGSANYDGATIRVPQMLAKNRRILLFTAAALMLVGFLSLVLWSSEKPYRAVYSGMAEKDAATVVDLLQKDHIPYRLEGGGTVMVPEDQVYQVRLKLAGQGVSPTGNTGFEIFDQSNEFGLSDFTRKINLQRALQGELARTIEVMPQVSAARIHLVMPKESAFAERDRKATASVMLQLAGGQRLPKKSVLAIQNLVAASIPELDQSDVTVVDSAGNLLSASEKEAPMSEGQTMAEYQNKLEQRIEQRITGMLEQVVGEGQAVVRVSADINREFIEQKNTRYNPDEQVLRSSKTISEQRKSSSGGPAIGVPGLASNTPGANQATAQAPVQQPQDSASRSENLNNYEISSTNEHRVVPFGNINKLSVAVVVGGTTTTNEQGAQSFTPRSKDELASLQTLVERAMGFDEDRGDTVDIQSMPLVDISSTADADALASAENRTFYMTVARYGLAGLALLLLGLFVLRPLGRHIQNSAERSKAERNPLALANQQGQLSNEAYARLANMEQVRQSIALEPERANKVLREWVDPS